MAYRPLADEIRPKNLDEVVGQRHILGQDGLLRRIIESGEIPNLIFYGPSGTGKTTVANIIAQRTNRPLHRLNATTASISDIKDIIADIGTLLAPEGVLLYLDEIQYFNKKQQQSLLEFMENGKITLIASTTENPFFYVFGAVLSRSTVFEFKQITAEDALPAVDRGVAILEERMGGRLTLEEDMAHMARLKEETVRRLAEEVPKAKLLAQGGAPHILAISLVGYKSEVVVRFLSDRGVYISSGSACHKGKPSHVFAALKLPKGERDGVLRISFSYDTKQEDVDALIEGLKGASEKLFPSLS